MKKAFNRILSLALAILFVLTSAPLGNVLAAAEPPTEHVAEEAPLATGWAKTQIVPTAGISDEFPHGGCGRGGRRLTAGEDYTGPTAGIPDTFQLTAFNNMGNGLQIEWPQYPFGAERFESYFLCDLSISI